MSIVQVNHLVIITYPHVGPGGLNSSWDNPLLSWQWRVTCGKMIFFGEVSGCGSDHTSTRQFSTSHLLGVISLAHGYLAWITIYSGIKRHSACVLSGQTSTGDIFPCRWLAQCPCTFYILKTGRSRQSAEYFHTVSILIHGCMTEGNEYSDYPKVNFILETVWYSIVVLSPKQLPLILIVMTTSP